jgi:hypothetical protein
MTTLFMLFPPLLDTVSEIYCKILFSNEFEHLIAANLRSSGQAEMGQGRESVNEEGTPQAMRATKSRLRRATLLRASWP